MISHFILLFYSPKQNNFPTFAHAFVTRQVVPINNEIMLLKSCHTVSKLYTHEETEIPNDRHAMSCYLCSSSLTH